MKKKFFYFFNISLILFVSFFSNYYYGSIGVFPIDTFAFFDSAQFINKGLLPIRDYWTSNGIMIDFIQSYLFKILGVSWSVYLLHSSLINFIFSFLTYIFFKNQGLNSSLALFYSISISILAYPSSGVPFPDHHSILLSLIGIYLLIFAIKNNKNYIWFVIPIIFFVAFLCKQVPSAFFVILISIYALTLSIKNNDYYKFIPLIISSFFSLLVFFLFLTINNIEIKSFFIQYIFFPLTIGGERGLNVNFFNLVLMFVKEFKFFSFLILILIFLLLKDFKIKKDYFEIFHSTKFIILLSTLIAVFNQVLMKNQNIIFFILPIVIGVIHANLFSLINNKKFFMISLILINIFITAKYHFRFNVDRKFMDLENVDKSETVNATELSEKLKGLKWVSSRSKINKISEVNLLKESINFLRENNSNSLIVTDYQFVLSEINHDIYPPNRWFTTDGTSYPLNKNIYYDFYKEFLREKLDNYNVDRIFTLGSIDIKSFNLILKENCIKTNKINDILLEHKLLNCLIKK